MIEETPIMINIWCTEKPELGQLCQCSNWAMD